MRAFWIGFGILLIATAALVFTGGNGSDGAAVTTPTANPAPNPATSPARPAAPPPAQPEPRPEPQPAPSVVSAPDPQTPRTNMPSPAEQPRDIDAGPGVPVASPQAAAPEQFPPEQPDEPAAPPVARQPESQPPSQPTPASPTGADVADAARPVTEAFAALIAEAEAVISKMAQYAPDPSKPLPVAFQPEPAAEPSTNPGPASPGGNPATAQAPAADAVPPVIKTATGIRLDNRWDIEGAGTAANPYKIDWDMLVAVQQNYKPRLGQTEVPEWIKALDGKVVSIRGYALLPTGMTNMSELLVMLNQWDACCIGVPPTPFDAIEVRLAKDLGPSARSMFSHSGALSYGDITGTFKVDPYIVQGWLLGLYLMEDASANLLGPAGTP